jgi:hypothetical protein
MRQFESDSSTERVRKLRERNRNVTATLLQRDSNVSETLDSVSVSDSLILKDSLTKKNKINGENQFSNNGWSDCANLYIKITNQPIVPSAHPEAYSELQAVLDLYHNDFDKALQEGKAIFANWCNTKGHSGKTYARTNTGWIGKWLEELAPQPEEDEEALKEKIRQEQLKNIQEATKYQR